MNLSLQGKILRALEEKAIVPVGGKGEVPVDVRILTATNKDLLARVNTGTFREDLYYRLNVVPIHLPPLRERQEDIPLLVDHFLKQKSFGKPKFKIPVEVMEGLMQYHWPGNIRELENLIERAVVLEAPEILTYISFPPQPTPFRPRGRAYPRNWFELSYKEAKKELLQDFEREFFRKALEKNQGNVSKTATMLSMHRRNLIDKLKTLAIDTKEFSELKKSS